MEDLTYAIGDIHGCETAFLMILEKIRQHAAGRPHTIITLGDYCDRGPNSKGVYDILMARPEIIPLMGNHEDMLLTAYDVNRFSEVNHFMDNGGKQTLASFDALTVRDIPAKYIDWIRNNTRLYAEDDLRVFVHAGIGKREPDMTKQPRQWLLWMREPFLTDRQPFFKYVVHGHTHSHSRKVDPIRPEVLDNRTNLDTGSFFTGTVTAGVFDQTQAGPLELLTACDPDIADAWKNR